MIRVPQILARLPRLNELAEGLGKELRVLKANEHPLNAEELAVYRHGLLDAIEGLGKGQGVLEPRNKYTDGGLILSSPAITRSPLMSISTTCPTCATGIEAPDGIPQEK
jgi:hypothetical protein